MNACGMEDGIEVLGEFGIAIMEQEAGIGHGPVAGGEVAGDLFQPGLVGEWSDASEDDAAGLEMEEEEDVAGGQAGGGPDFSGEEVGGSAAVPKPRHQRLGLRTPSSSVSENYGDQETGKMTCKLIKQEENEQNQESTTLVVGKKP